MSLSDLSHIVAGVRRTFSLPNTSRSNSIAPSSAANTRNHSIADVSSHSSATTSSGGKPWRSGRSLEDSEDYSPRLLHEHDVSVSPSSGSLSSGIGNTSPSGMRKIMPVLANLTVTIPPINIGKSFASLTPRNPLSPRNSVPSPRHGSCLSPRNDTTSAGSTDATASMDSHDTNAAPHSSSSTVVPAKEMTEDEIIAEFERFKAPTTVHSSNSNSEDTRTHSKHAQSPSHLKRRRSTSKSHHRRESKDSVRQTHSRRTSENDVLHDKQEEDDNIIKPANERDIERIWEYEEGQRFFDDADYQPHRGKGRVSFGTTAVVNEVEVVSQSQNYVSRSPSRPLSRSHRDDYYVLTY